MAEKFRRKVEGQLAAGTYATENKMSWDQFRVDYESKILAGKSSGTQVEAKIAMNHFERLVRPRFVQTIKTATIDSYKAKRRLERGRKVGDLVSPATVNKELRHLKAILGKAVKWKFLPELPDFELELEPEKEITYVSDDHFAAIYNACDVARMPRDLPFPAADWWRALITFNYLTGWRVGEPLALKRVDLDLEAGFAITRYTANKGKRDERVRLHPVVVEHLERIQCFEPLVFPWNHHRTTLWCELERIQVAAGIHLPCHHDHQHTPRCRVYGFHDLRRAFATENAAELTPDALQRLMRHKSYSTTQRYINMASQVNSAVEKLHVPAILRRAN
jgi:integrase